MDILLNKHFLMDKQIISQHLDGSSFNPLKPTESYLIQKSQRPLSDQHDQNIAEKSVVHSLLHFHCQIG